MIHVLNALTRGQLYAKQPIVPLLVSSVFILAENKLARVCVHYKYTLTILYKNLCVCVSSRQDAQLQKPRVDILTVMYRHLQCALGRD